MKKLDNSGFTIIELMIATAVFSTVLVGCAASMIYVGRQLHKADISIATQDSTRNIMEEVTRQLELSIKPPTVTNPGVVCVGAVRYSFVPNTQVEDNITGPHQGLHGLWRDVLQSSSQNCNSVAMNVNDPTSNSGSDNGKAGSGQELLPLHARLVSFSITNGTPPYPDKRLWDVDIAVLYGDDAVLITPGLNNCKGSSVGGAFCALSQLHTSVFRRVL